MSFQCDQCVMSFNHVGNYRRHKLIHSGEKPFKCEQCGKSFGQKIHLKNHINFHSDERPYKCDQCDMCFNHIGNFKRHKQIHSGEKPYKCDLCGRCFGQKIHLKNHINFHTKERPFKCELCDMSFNHIGNLRRHTLVHSGEKPFKCEYCGKGFAQKTHLKKHKTTHLKDKNYKPEESVVAPIIVKEEKTDHRPQRPHALYKCSYCERHFTQRISLRPEYLMSAQVEKDFCNECALLMRSDETVVIGNLLFNESSPLTPQERAALVGHKFGESSSSSSFLDEIRPLMKVEPQNGFNDTNSAANLMKYNTDDRKIKMEPFHN